MTASVTLILGSFSLRQIALQTRTQHYFRPFNKTQNQTNVSILTTLYLATHRRILFHSIGIQKSEFHYISSQGILFEMLFVHDAEYLR